MVPHLRVRLLQRRRAESEAIGLTTFEQACDDYGAVK
jgi:hypothetical protein